MDLHHLLLAGLPAHFESYMPSHAVGPLYVNKFALIWAARKPAYIRERRVQTVALEIHELAIAVAVLVHSVETINTLTAQASIAATF